MDPPKKKKKMAHYVKKRKRMGSQNERTSEREIEKGTSSGSVGWPSTQARKTEPKRYAAHKNVVFIKSDPN